MADEAFDLLCGLVLGGQRRWGDAAVDCQIFDAKAILNLDSPTPFSFLTRARGYSKTADIGGITSAVLAQRRRRIDHGVVHRRS